MSETQMTTLENILAAARSEFLEKGYRHAGLREIAAKAGVTTGALYGYFRNKEELFEALVGEEYAYILSLYHEILERFSEMPAEAQQANMQAYTAEGMTRMADYMYDHYDAFKLILCCSEGTAYSDLVHKMAALDVDATNEFTKTSSSAGFELHPVHPTLTSVLTGSLFSAFFEMIVHDIPREEAPEYTRQLLEFFTGGWTRIMGL